MTNYVSSDKAGSGWWVVCQGMASGFEGRERCKSRGQQRGAYEDTQTHTKALANTQILEGPRRESIQKVASCGILKADSPHYATMWRPAARLLNKVALNMRF